jgi:hypothetical protein
MTPARSSDYEWVGDDPRLFDEGFCLSIYTSATVDDVLAGLPQVASSSRGNYDALTELAYNNGRDLIGGLLQVGASAILYEPYGYLDDSAKQSLSTGRTVVSIDGNVAVSYFTLYRNGSNITRFEHIFPHGRSGDEPDAVLPLMEQVGGFGLDRDPDEGPEEGRNYLGASCALSEAITGVRLTYSLLTQQQYLICHFA